MKNVIAIALIFLATACFDREETFTVQEAGMSTEYDALVAAWEADESLPAIPTSCGDLRIAFKDAAVLGTVPGKLKGRTMSLRIGLDAATHQRTFIHLATHWLTVCTGLALELPAGTTHDEPRLWGVEGVQDKASAEVGHPRYLIHTELEVYLTAVGVCEGQGRTLADVGRVGAIPTLLEMWDELPFWAPAFWVGGYTQLPNGSLGANAMLRNGTIVAAAISGSNYQGAPVCELQALVVD